MAPKILFLLWTDFDRTTDIFRNLYTIFSLVFLPNLTNLNISNDYIVILQLPPPLLLINEMNTEFV